MSVNAGPAQSNPALSNRAIFLAALEIVDDDARRAFLARACGGDVERRGEIERLLAAADQGKDNPLDQVLEQLGPGETLQSEPSSGKRPEPSSPPVIDRYKIREQIGEGGMGVVYVAEQTSPVRRKVALKIIKPGMNSKDVVARFEAERQALAMMEHPNIARVLDAATLDDGRPYFVMELVKGVPITEFCDDNKLTHRRRLELFIDVCSAVQHAHQKGIIHRDLKPSNVMVTMNDGKPMPKVIDFGISKALSQPLTEHSIYTAYGQMIGTPLYMSPEQAQFSAVDVDTRSDVYSLGVLLYELLTGTTPFERERMKTVDIDELRRIIREEEPPRPSTRLSTLRAEQQSTLAASHGTDPRKLTTVLRGDLDWIVMKALEKDRNRRFESASALAADLERHLTNEPIEARPPSAVYRVQKFARRNRVALVTSLLVVVALLGGLAASLWQAVRATNQAARANAAEQLAGRRFKLAEASFQELRQSAEDYFTAVSETTLLDEPGLQPLRKELLQNAANYYEILARARPEDPEIQAELAAAHVRMAAIHSYTGSQPDCLAHLAKATKIVDGLLATHPDAAGAHAKLAGAWIGGRNLSGAVQVKARDFEQAKRTLEKAIDAWERLVQAYPSVVGFQSDLSKFYDKLVSYQDPEERLASARKVVELREAIVRKLPDNPQHSSELGWAYLHLASWGETTLKQQETEQLYRKALAAAETLPDMPAYREQLARVHRHFGLFLSSNNRSSEAANAYRRAAAAFGKLTSEFPHFDNYRDELASTQGLLANALRAAGRIEEAVELVGAVDLQPKSARDYVQRAQQYHQVHDFTNARLDYEKAVELEPHNPAWHHRLGSFLNCVQHPQHRDYGKALTHAKEAVRLEPENSIYRHLLGCMHRRHGDHEQALRELTRSIELDPSNASAYNARAELHHSKKNFEQGLADANRAVALGPSEFAYRVRGDLYRAMGKYENALADYQAAKQRQPTFYTYEVCASLYVELQQWPEALQDLDKAISLAPSRSWTYKRRGLVHFRLENFDEALADLAKAVELNPSDTSNLTWIDPALVAACPDENFRQGLLQLADRTVKLTDGVAAAHATRGVLLATLDARDKGLADFREIAERDDASYYACYQHALTCLATDDQAAYRKACAAMLAKFAATEKPREAYFTAWTCALAPAALEDYTIAIGLAERAVQRQSDDLSSRQALGCILLRAGRFDEALTHLMAAVAAADTPNTSPAYARYFLALTYHGLGNHQQAQDWHKKAAEHSIQPLNEGTTGTEEPLSWNRRVTLELLQRETETLLKLPVETAQPDPVATTDN